MTGALSTELRKQLEAFIKEARRVAEPGARRALEALAVDRARAHASMSAEEQALRKRLRAHGRQLGDVRDPEKETQEIRRLAREVAYEHWHRMLFARFLAENQLLIEPESRVAISMAECEELARKRGEDPWAFAGRAAARMLPRIFRPDDPALEVTLAPETRQALERLLESLPAEVFTADDSLGWTYQFWQAERKDEVNASGVKIGADELPAVTQLFTEHYMVLFLFHNTIGAWRAGKLLAEHPELAREAASQDALRRAVRLEAEGGYDFDYLRFVREKVDAPSRRAQGQVEETRLEGESTAQPGYLDHAEPIANLSGNLPHWRQDGVTYFVTFRAGDSLPREKLEQWERERAEWLARHPEPHDEPTRREYYERFPARFQRWLDAGYGKCLLAKSECKALVEAALRYFDGVRYDLDEFVVMPNHVHVIVTPKPGHELSEILHSWKSYTANRINEICGESGRFWQRESFDHILRSPHQLERIRQYIRDNPKEKVDAPSRRVQLEKTRLEGASTWRPAAGAFEGWPRRAAELRVLDPCCGSGHFLVEGLGLLVRLRMEEEGLARDDAIRAVLTENLFGLELDPRCTQIAAFNLALAAWKLAGRPIELPPLQIACSGLAIGATKPEWLALAGADERLRGGMARLYELFQKAPELGSLIDPHALTQDQQDLLAAELPDLEPLLAAALEREADDNVDAPSRRVASGRTRLEGASTLTSTDDIERAIAAQGMARAAALLAGTYTLVITNVPYLGRGNQTAALRKFAEEHHPEAKADLATIFVSRAFRWLGKTGTQAVVTPQNWLFLTSYKKLREKLLSLRTWNLVARLGPGAFETIGGHVVNVALSVLSAAKPDPDWQMAGLDVSACRGERPIPARAKAELLRSDAGARYPGEPTAEYSGVVFMALQRHQAANPDARVDFRAAGHLVLLELFATNHQGLSTGDNPRFRRNHWEVAEFGDVWVPEQTSSEITLLYAGRSGILRWERGQGELYRFGRANVEALHNVDRRGEEAWGRQGVGLRQMGSLAATLYTGEHFDTSVAALIPARPEYLPAVWCFCESGAWAREMRAANPKLSIDNGYITKVPFDLAHWQKVAVEKYPNGLPEPQSDDPTQWLFHGHPAGAQPEAALQVAVARLLGYRWPAEVDAPSRRVPSEDKRLEAASTLRLAEEARVWVARCGELAAFADGDGIVCLSALRGEAGAADRLRRLLAAAFGGAWSGPKERELLAAAAAGGKAAESLEEWLRERFFEEHCKLFHHRPFVWHVWDGRRDGFHALVSYHRLAGRGGVGRRTLEALTYSYLGDWIGRQKAEQREGREGSDARLAAAQDLQAQLERILAGEPPCDLFVRWKPLHRQPIGWEPDLDDGVRLNIRPFLRAELRTGGRKGAGLLRWKPNIKWSKDRGKEPKSLRPREDYPWFWACPGDGSETERTDFEGGPTFDGNRWNDLHYTTAAKRAARSRHGGVETP